MPTKAEWVAMGADPRFIIDRETHPGYFHSSWSIDPGSLRLLGKKTEYHFSHVTPCSVLVAPIGNMWVEHSWHRLQDMVHSMEQKGYVVSIQEINDSCILPGDAQDHMRTQATYLAMDSGVEWFFMVENDALLELDTLERLLAWDRPVVAPLCIDLEQRWIGTDTSYPPLKPGTGLQPVAWTVMTAMLFNVRVFNAITPESWINSKTEYQFHQKLNHAGHRCYVDTNTKIDVARSPARPRSIGWDEYWEKQKASYESSRNEERDRRPPAGFDPVFSLGKVNKRGVYLPVGSSTLKDGANGAH